MKSIILMICLLIGSIATADDVFVVIMQKQEEKKQRGWSLLGWMETQKQIALMDQWLALNSSASSTEFYLNLEHANYKLNGSKHNYYKGAVGAFFSIIGLEGEFEDSIMYTKIAGQVSLRLLGSSNQYTNLTVHYGYRSVDDQYNTYAGANLTFNIFPFFGVEAMYRKLFRGSNEGETYHFGPFMDISFVRLYAQYFNEEVGNSRFTGTRLGLKAYF